MGSAELFLVDVACWVFLLSILVGVGLGGGWGNQQLFRYGVVGLLSVNRLDSEGDFLQLIGVVGYNNKRIIIPVTMVITHCFFFVVWCGWEWLIWLWKVVEPSVVVAK